MTAPMAPTMDEALRAEAEGFACLVAFRERYLAVGTDSPPARFHYVWSNQLLRGDGHYACEGFRESGKDQIVFQAYLLHSLTYPTPDRRYIVIVANTQTLASTKLRDVTRQFQARDRDILRLGVAKIVEDSAVAFQVAYEDGTSTRIEAYGKGASMRGLVWGTKRPDILILNDIQDLEDMNSPVTLERDWDWFLSDIMFLGNASRIFLIGNNLGEKCVIERCIRNAYQLDFKAEIIPVMTGEEGSEESTWPERFPVDAMLQEREAFRELGKIDVWMRERMCKAVAPESRPLHVEDLRYYDSAGTSLTDCTVVTMVDPAVHTKTSNDPSVIATVAIAPDGTRYVMDVDRGRRDLNGLTDAIFRAVVKHSPHSVGVETVAAQEYLAQNLENEMRRRNTYFSLVRVKTTKKKEPKILGRLSPVLKAGLFKVPYDAPWLQDLKDEISSFPTGLHDDILDALAMVDDARTVRLIPYFDHSTCVAPAIDIPSHWPVWHAFVPDHTGECVMLGLTCSPENKLYVYSELFLRLSPESTYGKYRDFMGDRVPKRLMAPDYMWKEHPVTGRLWVHSWLQAGFRLSPASGDWDLQIPALERVFQRAPEPQLKIFPRCKRLLWELYSAGEGEAAKTDRKAIQALMLLVSIDPIWGDKRRRTSRDLRYPGRDVP